MNQASPCSADIERLTNVLRATEMERDAGDKVADNLRAEIERLKAEHGKMSDSRREWMEACMTARGEIEWLRALCVRAADALECHNIDHLQDDLIAELRKVAS